MLLTIDEHGSKIARNSVFGFHLLPVAQKMEMENYFLTIFINVR